MWFVQDTIKLIERFKNYPELWDPDNIGHKDREKRRVALKNLADEFAVDIMEVERKLKGLRTQFAREMVKYEHSNGKYKSPWFGFSLLHFLVKSRKTRGDSNNDVVATAVIIENPDDENETGSFKIPDFSISAENGTDCNNSGDENVTTYMLKEESEMMDDFPLKRSLVYLATTNEDDGSSSNSSKRFHSSGNYDEKSAVNITATDDFQTTARELLLHDNGNNNNNNNNTIERDEFVVFGEHVANKLRHINDPYARSVAQYYISNILFQTETTNYNKNLVFKPPTSDFTLFHNVGKK